MICTQKVHKQILLFCPENVHFTKCLPFCRITNLKKMKSKFQSIIANLIRFSIVIFLHNAVLVRFGSMKSRKIDLQISPPKTSRNFREEAIIGKIGGKIRFWAKNANYLISTQKYSDMMIVTLFLLCIALLMVPFSFHYGTFHHARFCWE